MSVHLLSNAKLDVRETPVEHPSRPRKGAALRDFPVLQCEYPNSAAAF